ncbi:hypothetical protein [Streptomyces sirii]|uniref:hypothetical protein n=1 Tax=Streptomyces sirii TaxID=3127701 RepID=UPI003D36B8B5
MARRIREAAARRGLRSGTRGSRVSKWETGRADPDEDESQPLIAEVFGIHYAAVSHLGWPNWLPAQDQPLPLGPHNAVPSLREALMTSLDRRSFIAYTSGALAALAHQWADTEPGPFARWTPHGDVDTDLVTWLETAGAELIRLATERRKHTHRLLQEHLTTTTGIISEGRYTRSVEHRLHTLAASLAQAIAWQRFDERRHASAGRFWHAALHNAHTAGQRDLGAGILSDLAYQLLWLNDARGAVNILELAIPRTQHPTARSLLHLRQARALAVLNEDGLCRRALTAAEKALESPSYDPPHGLVRLDGNSGLGSGQRPLPRRSWPAAPGPPAHGRGHRLATRHTLKDPVRVPDLPGRDLPPRRRTGNRRRDRHPLPGPGQQDQCAQVREDGPRP